MKWRLPSLLPPARHLRIALVFAVLVATAAQQLVAQAHWHSLPGTHASVAAPADDAGTRTQDSCLLCQVAAHAGAVAPPSAVHLFTANHDQVFHSASYHEADVPAEPAHAWQSRGPPAA